MKVYELAEKLKKSSKETKDILKKLKINKSDDFSDLTLKEISIVESHLGLKSKEKDKAEEESNDKKVFLVKKHHNNDKPSDESKNNETKKSKVIPIRKKVKIKKKKVVVRKHKEQEISASNTSDIKEETQKSSEQANEKVAEEKKYHEKEKQKPELKEKHTSTDGKEQSQEGTGEKKEKKKFKISQQKKSKVTKTPASEESQEKDKKKTWKTYKSKKRKFEKKEKEKEKEKNFVYQARTKKGKPEKTASVPKTIEIMETISVTELARKMNIKASELIAKFISLGEMVTINQAIDSETASLVASEYGCETKIISLYDETIIHEEEDKPEDIEPRAPIITIMGHVDHGKTKLLDSIRKSNIIKTESGGITQHIGAYKIHLEKGSIVFLDTPGHEAFTAMRARGAKITDIVVLVVAADDGVMPQTIEAINHAKAAEVPIIVAINKMDSPQANLDKVKQQLTDYELVTEEWGGNTMMVPISALKNENIDKLLEGILLEAEMLELKANPHKRGVGHIIESKIDQGRGAVATILIQNGSVRVGDNFVAGIYSGKIRALFDDRGNQMEVAEPSTPVEILGLGGVPEAGDPFHVVETEKEAKSIGAKRQELKRIERAKKVQRVTLENFYDKLQEGEVQELALIVKGDVQGSVEALKDSFTKLSNKKVKVVIKHSGTGAINKEDVILASASDAIIIGFHVRPNSKAASLAQKEKVEIKKYNIIYNAIDAIKAAIEGMLTPEYQEEVTGIAEVRDIFKISKVGTIAGCYVTEGTINRNHSVRVIRDDIEVYTGEIASLKRFKEDVVEVRHGFECGISIQKFNDIKQGDSIETFYMKETPAKL